jgi:hypothetical protein
LFWNCIDNAFLCVLELYRQCFCFLFWNCIDNAFCFLFWNCIDNAFVFCFGTVSALL